MKYRIEFELPDNETVFKEIETKPVKWSIWGHSGYAYAKPIKYKLLNNWKHNSAKQWDIGQRIGYRRGYLEGFYNAMKNPDCEHAERDGVGCLGYCGCWQDDEPIDACKECEKYTGNISERAVKCE